MGYILLLPGRFLGGFGSLFVFFLLDLGLCIALLRSAFVSPRNLSVTVWTPFWVLAVFVMCNPLYVINVFLPDGPPGYDCYYAHVIVASTAKEAVQMAANRAADEGPDCWANSVVDILGPYIGATGSHIVQSSFRAG